MSAMTKRKLANLLTVIAIAVDLIAAVLLIPVLISPTGAGAGIVVPLTAAIIVGAVLGLSSSILRGQAKAATHQADGA